MGQVAESVGELPVLIMTKAKEMRCIVYGTFILSIVIIKEELSIGIDKESKSISFFCCSLYMDERGFFSKNSVSVQYNLCV